MAEEKKKNIYQRLMQARIDFAKKNIQPSGYNVHLNFDYLELKDIIPVANKVMQDNNIMLITDFTSMECVGKVIDLGGEEEPIVFSIPLPDPTKDAERLKLNVVAMIGAQVTYLRRYMYMLVLDITMNDEVDADGEETPVVKPAVKSTPKKSEPKTEKKEEKPAVKGKVVVSSEKKSPATPEKRAEIKKELTDANGQATDLQVQTLKAIMMRWVNTCPADKEKATELLVKTNGFATCTKKEADELIDMINGKIAKGEGAKK
jgi:hypothetical protein